MTLEIKPLSEDELASLAKTLDWVGSIAQDDYSCEARLIATIRQLQGDGENLHAKMRELETVIFQKDKEVAKLKKQLSQVRKDQIEKDAQISLRICENDIYVKEAGLTKKVCRAIRSQLTHSIKCPECAAPWGNDCEQFGCWNCGLTHKGKEE